MAATVGSKEYVEAQRVLSETASKAVGLIQLRTPAQKAQQTAYNEFIADYVERHGECKATRDEAHEVASWIESMAIEVARLCNKYAVQDDIASDAANDLSSTLIDDNSDIDGKEEAYHLSSCAIAAALELA